MTDSNPDPLQGLLSQFALGPSWARDPGKQGDASKSGSPRPDKEDSPRHQRDDRRRDHDSRDRRDGRDNREGGRDGRRFQGGRKFEDRRGGPPRHEDIPPAPGVRVTIVPDHNAVHLIGKEVHQVARVYPLFDVAQTLLAERSRCRALFETDEKHPAFFSSLLDESLFLSREEALQHLWQSELRSQVLDEETVEAEAPTGNFQSVAKCGLSGEWLGPPNFHSYQKNLRRLHRERFSHLPFEVYSSKVRTERGEEAVTAWLETTKQKTRWRLKGDDEAPWLEDRADAERALSVNGFDKAFKETRKAEISAAVPGKNLSPSLLASLRIAGSHARKHPAILIPAICRSLEAEHLPVFKRQGKLHTGPARPHALAADAVLAERPGKMVAWIRENSPAKLGGLWQAVLPEGSTAPPADYAADLFWLLQQGHILLYTDDTLVVQEVKEQAAPKEPKKEKEKTPKQEKAKAESENAGAPEETQQPAPGTTDEEGKLPDADWSEPSEEPQQPGTPEESCDSSEIIAETPESPEVEEAPEPPAAEPIEEPAGETGQPAPVATGEEDKLPDEDWSEPSEEPQKPE